jgi:hypothetical protein
VAGSPALLFRFPGLRRHCTGTCFASKKNSRQACPPRFTARPGPHGAASPDGPGAMRSRSGRRPGCSITMIAHMFQFRQAFRRARLRPGALAPATIIRRLARAGCGPRVSGSCLARGRWGDGRYLAGLEPRTDRTSLCIVFGYVSLHYPSVVLCRLVKQPNGWLHPLGGCGVRAFATELTTMRVEQLKSREIAQSGASRG